MTTTEENLSQLFDAIPSTDSWIQKGNALYLKSFNRTAAEDAAWQKVQERNYIDFADAEKAQSKIRFLEAYIKADTNTKIHYYDKASALFTGGQSAVIAVRLNSLEVLNFGMPDFLDYLSSSHDYNLITEVYLIYDALKRLGINADLYFQTYLSKLNDSWTISFIEKFLNQIEIEKSVEYHGYKGVFDPNFGYIMQNINRTNIDIS